MSDRELAAALTVTGLACWTIGFAAGSGALPLW